MWSRRLSSISSEEVGRMSEDDSHDGSNKGKKPDLERIVNTNFGRPHLEEREFIEVDEKRLLIARHNYPDELFDHNCWAFYSENGDNHWFGGPHTHLIDIIREGQETLVVANEDSWPDSDDSSLSLSSSIHIYSIDGKDTAFGQSDGVTLISTVLIDGEYYALGYHESPKEGFNLLEKGLFNLFNFKGEETNIFGAPHHYVDPDFYDINGNKYVRAQNKKNGPWALYSKEGVSNLFGGPHRYIMDIIDISGNKFTLAYHTEDSDAALYDVNGDISDLFGGPHEFFDSFVDLDGERLMVTGKRDHHITMPEEEEIDHPPKKAGQTVYSEDGKELFGGLHREIFGLKEIDGIKLLCVRHSETDGMTPSYYSRDGDNHWFGGQHFDVSIVNSKRHPFRIDGRTVEIARHVEGGPEGLYFIEGGPSPLFGGPHDTIDDIIFFDESVPEEARVLLLAEYKGKWSFVSRDGRNDWFGGPHKKIERESLGNFIHDSGERFSLNARSIENLFPALHDDKDEGWSLYDLHGNKVYGRYFRYGGYDGPSKSELKEIGGKILLSSIDEQGRQFFYSRDGSALFGSPLVKHKFIEINGRKVALGSDSKGTWSVYSREGMSLFGGPYLSILDIINAEGKDMIIARKGFPGPYVCVSEDGNDSYFGGPHDSITKLFDLNVEDFMKFRSKRKERDAVYKKHLKNPRDPNYFISERPSTGLSEEEKAALSEMVLSDDKPEEHPDSGGESPFSPDFGFDFGDKFDPEGEARKAEEKKEKQIDEFDLEGIIGKESVKFMIAACPDKDDPSKSKMAVYSPDGRNHWFGGPHDHIDKRIISMDGNRFIIAKDGEMQYIYSLDGERCFCKNGSKGIGSFFENKVGGYDNTAFVIAGSSSPADKNLRVYTPDGRDNWYVSGSDTRHAGNLGIKDVYQLINIKDTKLLFLRYPDGTATAVNQKGVRCFANSLGAHFFKRTLDIDKEPYVILRDKELKHPFRSHKDGLFCLRTWDRKNSGYFGFPHEDVVDFFRSDYYHSTQYVIAKLPGKIDDGAEDKFSEQRKRGYYALFDKEGNVSTDFGSPHYRIKKTVKLKKPFIPDSDDYPDESMLWKQYDSFLIAQHREGEEERVYSREGRNIWFGGPHKNIEDILQEGDKTFLKAIESGGIQFYSPNGKKAFGGPHAQVDNISSHDNVAILKAADKDKGWSFYSEDGRKYFGDSFYQASTVFNFLGYDARRLFIEAKERKDKKSKIYDEHGFCFDDFNSLKDSISSLAFLNPNYILARDYVSNNARNIRSINFSTVEALMRFDLVSNSMKIFNMPAGDLLDKMSPLMELESHGDTLSESEHYKGICDIFFKAADLFSGSYNFDIDKIISVLKEVFSADSKRFINSLYYNLKLKKEEMNSLEDIADCSRIDIKGYDIVKKMQSGTWGTTYLAISAGQKYVVKVPNDNVDLSIKGNKKVVDVFGNGDLDTALNAMMEEEALNSAKLSNEGDESLNIRPEKGYIPIVLYHPPTIMVKVKGKDKIANVYTKLPGQTLSDIFTKGAFDYETFFEVMPEVAYALGHVHENGLCHNDFKPDNIFYNRKLKQAKLIDFAFARKDNYSGSLIGMRCYTDPQKLLGKHSDSKKADMYSFGCVLYESLTGRLPVEFGEGASKDLTEAFLAKGEINPTDIRQYRPDLHEGIANFIMKCLSPSLDKRYISMREVEEELVKLKKEIVGDKR